jgi:signal transduction histidine kinase
VAAWTSGSAKSSKANNYIYLNSRPCFESTVFGDSLDQKQYLYGGNGSGGLGFLFLKHYDGCMKLKPDRSAAAPPGGQPKRRRYTSSVILLVIAVGVAGSALAGMNTMLINRDQMMSQARVAADAISAEEVSELDGSDKDLGNATYQDLKKRLGRMREANPGTRFVYLLGLKENNDVFFLVDSESEKSESYSPPGEVYPEASLRLKAAFSDDTPFLEGPSRDSFGTWISALAPVIDQSTGKTVAVLGVDEPAKDYFVQIAIYALIPLILAAIPLAVLYRNRKLEAKEREITDLKTQFVSVASHELRSPLNGVLWAVQSLIKPGASPNLKDDQLKLLTSVYNNTASSVATVNEILDFSIFDRGKANKLLHEQVDLRDVLNDVEKILTLSSQEAGVTLAYPDKWPQHIFAEGDPGAFKRAFSNILSNAIKYSPKGSTIELAHKSEGSNHVISVRDHGIGIPASEQTKVLEGYYRAANAAKVKAHGTGMGLWVTKKIIEQHGGKLWLESKENEGTTIFASIPIADKGSESSPTPLQPESGQPKNQHPDSTSKDTP